MIQTCTYLYSNNVLSTMGVSMESTSKFLIGNRFHVKLRILSPNSNVILREIDFLLKIC